MNIRLLLFKKNGIICNLKMIPFLNSLCHAHYYIYKYITLIHLHVSCKIKCIPPKVPQFINLFSLLRLMIYRCLKGYNRCSLSFFWHLHHLSHTWLIIINYLWLYCAITSLLSRQTRSDKLIRLHKFKFSDHFNADCIW